ncbi:MAG: VIT1/CCC1 transporter family protein [Planctomycetota bacterium]
MPVQGPSSSEPYLTDSDMSDHVTAARERARTVFSGEGHTVAADDWRYSALSGRNAAILLCLVWDMLTGFGAGEPAGWMLLASGVGIALFLGIAAGLVTHTEVNHLEAELERERREVAEDPQHEREEIMTLYAAKGFREPLLSQVVDVLCVDDDRLLKVMMEEELGLFIRLTTHPVLVGVANGLTALAVGLFLAAPVFFLAPSAAAVWVPMSGAFVVAVLALVIARHTKQPALPMAARWLIMGAVCVGVVHFLSRWLSGQG